MLNFSSDLKKIGFTTSAANQIAKEYEETCQNDCFHLSEDQYLSDYLRINELTNQSEAFFIEQYWL